MTYYFDTLPLHPPPQLLESFTSYLLRVAESNVIHSVDELVALCFPDQNRRITREVGDYPPLSLKALSAATVTTVPTLLATTFYHLVAKFGRSTHPQAASRFLGGSLAGYLRYCPACLVEHTYYTLPWRFLALSGCVEHRCLLHDACGWCGKSIPLTLAPLKISICPYCWGDLYQILLNSSAIMRVAATNGRR
jgi:hypothetical protein